MASPGEARMQLDGDCRMTVYFNGSKVTTDCAPKECFGRRLLAATSAAQPIGAAVRIGCGDSIYLGEIEACWPSEGGAYVVVKLIEVLHCSSELQALWSGGSRAAGNGGS